MEIRTVKELRAQVAQWRAAGDTIALVPTMGALHDGHLALVAAGREWGADPARGAQRGARTRCVVSIFVNPTQFGPAEDLARYPRDEAGDLAKLASIGVDAAFLPDVREMYPWGTRADVQGGATVVVVGELPDKPAPDDPKPGSKPDDVDDDPPTTLTSVLEGPLRPGHFRGVATVVAKLLLQCLPDVALFGEKDYQQLQVVKRLAEDLMIPTEIVGVPTIREPDGLALSSRNRYLSADERRIAAMLPRVLFETAERLVGRGGGGSTPAETEALLGEASAQLKHAGFGPVQYLALADAETLAPLASFDPATNRPARLLVAAYLGKTRLIDNVAVG